MMRAPRLISTFTAKANPTYSTRCIAAFSLLDARSRLAVVVEVSFHKKGLRQKDILLTQSPCDAGQEVSKKTNEQRSGLHSSSTKSLVKFDGCLHLLKTVVDERKTAIEEIHLRG